MQLNKSRKQEFFAIMLVLPTFLYLTCFQIYPLFESLRLSFTDTNLINKTSNFVGLKNYIYLFTEDQSFWLILINSFKWIFLSLLFQVVVAFIVALTLNSKFKLQALCRGLSMVPWMMPVVIVGLMWRWMFDYQNGIVNIYFKDLGIVDNSINWFGDEKLVWVTLILSATWKGFGYLTIMLLAGLKGIPGEMYESAHIDGANSIKTFFYITVPFLMPVLFVALMIQIITSWTKFEMIWVLTGGGPGYATSILPTYVYTNTFDYFKMGMGSAVAVISTIIIVILLILYTRLNKQEKING